MDIPKKAIGARIKQKRKEAGLTQAQLAEKADLEAIYISQLERGLKVMSVAALFRIAAELKTRPGWILDGHGQDAFEDEAVRRIRSALAECEPGKRAEILKVLEQVVGLCG